MPLLDKYQTAATAGGSTPLPVRRCGVDAAALLFAEMSVSPSFFFRVPEKTPRTPTGTIGLSVSLFYRAQNAIYQGRGYSKRARDGRRLDSRPERRPDEVRSSLRNLVNLP